MRTATAATSFVLDEGLPGRVAATAEPAWVADISADPNFPRAEAALGSGIRAAFAFPVMAQKRVVGVLEFFHDHRGEPDGRLLEVMESVGAQIGRVFERAQANDESRVASCRC
jgi:GAF domain-containing protein